MLMQIGQAVWILVVLPPDILSILVATWSPGALKSSPPLLIQVLSLSIGPCLMQALSSPDYLLYKLDACIQYPILLHCDNLSAIYMVSNPVFHACTKHIELNYHFVREKVALGSHWICYIPSIDQPEDVLTKCFCRFPAAR